MSEFRTHRVATNDSPSVAAVEGTAQKPQTEHQKRFSEAVRDAQGVAKSKGRNVAIIYDEASDRIDLCEPHIAEDWALQATILPNGDIREAKTINQKFCEV